MEEHKNPARIALFWAKVEKEEHERIGGLGPCWVWTAKSHDQFNYGVFGWTSPQPRTMRAHRFSWMVHTGIELVDGECVLHRCDNPRCVRPAHLFVGDRATNNADMKSKRRHEHGEAHRAALLTEDQVREIRALAAVGELKHKDIGARFGVGRQAVGLIVQRKRWTHVAA